MILANVRARLRASDMRLAVTVLARGREAERRRYEHQLAAEGPDAILDNPALLKGLLALRTILMPSPVLFTYVAVRHALLASGIDDVELADYLAAVLVEFGARDRATRIARHDDQIYAYLVDLVADLEAAEGERGFLLQTHLGNYALWLAGLFPDHIAARRARNAGPDLPYYDALGRRGYQLASDHALADRFGLAAIFRTAAERFPSVRLALNRMSDRIFFPNVVTADRLLRELQ